MKYVEEQTTTAFAVYLGMVRAYVGPMDQKRVFPAAVRGWKGGQLAVDVARGVVDTHRGTLERLRAPTN